MAGHHPRAQRAAARPRGADPDRWQPLATLSRIGACFVCFAPICGTGAVSDRGFAGAAVTDRRRLLAGVSVSGPTGGPDRPTTGKRYGTQWTVNIPALDANLTVVPSRRGRNSRHLVASTKARPLSPDATGASR